MQRACDWTLIGLITSPNRLQWRHAIGLIGLIGLIAYLRDGPARLQWRHRQRVAVVVEDAGHWEGGEGDYELARLRGK